MELVGDETVEGNNNATAKKGAGSKADNMLGDLKLYPDPEQKYLRNALASSVRGVVLTRENIFVSNGSDDILNFAFASFAGGSEKAVFPDIS